MEDVSLGVFKAVESCICNGKVNWIAYLSFSQLPSFIQAATTAD